MPGQSPFTSPPLRWQYAKKADEAKALQTCSSSTSPGTGADQILRPMMLTRLMPTSTTNGTIDCAGVFEETALGHDQHAHAAGVFTGCQGAFQTASAPDSAMLPKLMRSGVATMQQGMARPW